MTCPMMKTLMTRTFKMFATCIEYIQMKILYLMIAEITSHCAWYVQKMVDMVQWFAQGKLLNLISLPKEALLQ